MSNLAKPVRILLLGAPGSGKGTQTSRLVSNFPNIHSVSSGDLLRREIANKTDLGAIASKYIASGKLLPDQIVNDMVIDHLHNNKWLSSNATWLLDGYPRNASQAKMLYQKLNPANANLNFVVELDVPNSVILERIENRYVHIPSGRIYNLTYNPPKVPGKDDLTGEPLSKRPDDTREVFSKRLDQYKDTVEPLKAFYKNQGVLHTVSGETSDIIYPKLRNLITELFGNK